MLGLMRRSLALVAVLLVGCGPVDPVDGGGGTGGSGGSGGAAGGITGGGEAGGASAGGSTSAGGGSSGGGAGGLAGGGSAGGGLAGGGLAGGGLAGGGMGGGATAGGRSGGGAGGGSAGLAALDAAAVGSACYRYQWMNRGQMPRGFIKGVARAWARALCEPTRSELALVSQAQTTDTVHDALAWYQAQFAAVGMSNGQPGVDTLRHVYVLLLGLGMRESSGRHCVGRDTSATNTTASTAEAGAWQTSYNSHGFHTQLDVIIARFATDNAHCHLSTFAEGVTCSAADWQNWGTGPGFDFQKREKECPVFAAEYAAVMMRVSGGSGGHYGPLRTRTAELRPECDAMLQQVQQLVSADPSICAAL
jgi:hypothetical protein